MGNIDIQILGEHITIDQAVAIAFEAGNVCALDIVLEEIDDITDYPGTVLLAVRDRVEEMRRVILDDIGDINQSAKEAVQRISEDDSIPAKLS